MEKKIIVCIGTDRSKHMRARLSLLTMEGDAVVFEHYHSIAIEPGADLAAIRKANEAHLANPTGGIPGAPWPAIPDEEWADVEAHVGITHKPHAVTAHREKLVAQNAEREAQAASDKEAQEKAEAELQAKFKAAVAEAVATLEK